MKEQKILTVSELTKDIKIILQTAFPSVWVEGEVSNLTPLSINGHIYFDLKDSKNLLKCTFFKNHQINLKFKLENGLHIVCFGKVSSYEPKSTYQLNVQKIEPKGLGALQLAFEQLKEKLNKEGLFEERFKKPIPYLPQKIGIVTSPRGAVIHDILRAFEQRFNNIEVIIKPVRVQGEAAGDEIAQAIKEFNELKNVDVIIVGRGGGSIEDLWPFNEEVVARAIFASKIPIISAVGHEDDYVISDFVADKRAMTPTKAAELVLPKKEDLQQRIDELIMSLDLKLRHILELCLARFKTLSSRLTLLNPKNIIEHSSEKNKNLNNRLNFQFNQILCLKDNELRRSLARLEALSPLKVLSRGYSIAFKYDTHTVIKNISDVEIGQEIETRINDGVLLSKVRGKWHKK